MVELKPIRETTEDYDRLEKQIIDILRLEIYLPLLAIIGSPESLIKNSINSLIDAIMSGRIEFYRGEFKGSFNSTISSELRRLGARRDLKQGSYKIPLSDLPIEIRTAISSSQSRFLRTLDAINIKLGNISPKDISDKLHATHLFDSTLWKVESEMKKSMRNITVSPELSPDESLKISQGYNEDMKRWIKDFTAKEVKELRDNINKSALSGQRYDGMIKQIKDSYGVSHRKAKFLARQETGLMMAKFKETRYQAAGVDEYKWQCVVGSKNHPVRPMHKRLNGKIFRFDHPPITDEKGSRNNPGQDFNCRCVAVPIVKF